MNNTASIGSPISNSQLLNICHYITSFGIIFYNEGLIQIHKKNQTVPVINAFYQYLNGSSNATEARIQLLRKITGKPDFYNDGKNKILDTKYVNETYQYIIDIGLFSHYGNISGYVSGIMKRRKNSTIPDLKKTVIEDLSKNYKDYNFCSSRNETSKLIRLAIEKLTQEYVWPAIHLAINLQEEGKQKEQVLTRFKRSSNKNDTDRNYTDIAKMFQNYDSEIYNEDVAMMEAEENLRHIIRADNIADIYNNLGINIAAANEYRENANRNDINDLHEHRRIFSPGTVHNMLGLPEEFLPSPEANSPENREHGAGKNDKLLAIENYDSNDFRENYNDLPSSNLNNLLDESEDVSHNLAVSIPEHRQYYEVNSNIPKTIRKPETGADTLLDGENDDSNDFGEYYHDLPSNNLRNLLDESDDTSHNREMSISKRWQYDEVNSDIPKKIRKIDTEANKLLDVENDDSNNYDNNLLDVSNLNIQSAENEDSQNFISNNNVNDLNRYFPNLSPNRLQENVDFGIFENNFPNLSPRSMQVLQDDSQIYLNSDTEESPNYGIMELETAEDFIADRYDDVPGTSNQTLLDRLKRFWKSSK